MAEAVRLDPDPRIAAMLMRHPGVAAAKVRIAEDGVVEARVLPASSRRRVPAAGRCALIDAAGDVFEAELVDVSWSGVCVRFDEGRKRPPALDAEVQLWIESEALGGGVDGWLGRVRWVRGGLLGVSFAGNADEGAPLIQLVDAFARCASEAPAGTREPVAGRPLRVCVDRRAELHVGTLEVPARTLDASVSGVGIRLAESSFLDLRMREVRVRIDAAGLWDEAFQATVVRQDGDRIGLAVRSDAAATRALATLAEREAARDDVSTAALADWLRGLGMLEPIRVQHVAAATG
jgi:hypothetical protein